MAAEGAGSLVDRLARNLPNECHFLVHHLSSPAIKTSPIFAPAPGQCEELTFEERHFLSVSIENNGDPIQVFALDVNIYTTERLTTVFVAKADSTGYLYLINLSKGLPSPFRIICTTFLGFLVEEHARPDRPLVVSLFARSQSQYIFPGSEQNDRKHILDDRALIKWWCKVADTLLEKSHCQPSIARPIRTGYLRVPGCDQYEMRGFFPNGANGGHPIEWKNGDPLQELARSRAAPERCLIPRFPDDPKARFLVDLDDELPERETASQTPVDADGQTVPANSSMGRWRSVKSLEHFWEAMAFRQECAAGRLVGFIWAVFKPRNPQHAYVVDEILDWDVISNEPLEPATFPMPMDRITWLRHSQGEVSLPVRSYNLVGKRLSKSDYGNVFQSVQSTKALIQYVAEKARIQSWGQKVVGQMGTIGPRPPDVPEKWVPTTLDTSLLRKRKRPVTDGLEESPKHTASAEVVQEDAVAKKAKTVDATTRETKVEES